MYKQYKYWSTCTYKIYIVKTIQKSVEGLTYTNVRLMIHYYLPTFIIVESIYSFYTDTH